MSSFASQITGSVVWTEFFIIGSLLGSWRKILSDLTATIINSFFVTAEFEDKDDTFRKSISIRYDPLLLSNP